MNEAWNKNARERHQQVLSGKDITFSKLLVPDLIRILKRLKGYSSFSVLDIGCGTGILTGILAKHVASVFGIDPSIECIRIAREHNKESDNTTFRCNDIETYGKSHDDQQFDLALAHMSLQSVADLSGSVKVIGTLLKPQGWFLFTISHPCFWALVKTSFPRDEYMYHLSSSHQISFTIHQDQKPLSSPVHFFHRPLSVYSESLNEAGFVVSLLSEPMPSSELMKEYSRPWDYPGFILWLCRKSEMSEL